MCTCTPHGLSHPVPCSLLPRALMLPRAPGSLPVALWAGARSAQVGTTVLPERRLGGSSFCCAPLELAWAGGARLCGVGPMGSAGWVAAPKPA